MARTKIGVVTVTFNSANVLPDFLRCLQAQSHGDFILYAVDNASKDGTVALLKKCTDSRIECIANADNRGVAEGNNQGIRRALEAGCGSLLLLNNDVEFGTGLLEELSSGLETHQCAMVCPKILYFDDPSRIWAAGGYFQKWLGYRALHFGENELDRGQFDQARPVTYSPTCCVLIKAEVFTEIGLMDARYFVYVDDVDFMYRALKAGCKLVYLAQSILLHKVGMLTGGSESSFSIRLGVRNRSYFALKHLGSFTGTFWIALRWSYYLAKCLTFQDSFGTFKFKHRAICEAYEMRAQS